MDLEHGLERVEEIRQRLETVLDGFLSGTGETVPAPCPATFRFLSKYAIGLSHPELQQKLGATLRILAESSRYDSVEGGFFESGPGSRKTLATNSGWLIVALRLRRPGQGEIAGTLARSLLRYVQTRLLLSDGTLAAEQQADEAYYALDIHQRRLLSPPPALHPASPLACAAAAQAFSKAYQSFGEPSYRGVALRALRASVEPAPGTAGGEGASPILACELGLACLSLYNATLDSTFLERARSLARELMRDRGMDLPPEALSRGASFLLLASAQLQDDTLARGVRDLVDPLLVRRPDSEEEWALAGNALLSMLLPLALFTAVTDGSQAQKEKVLVRIRSFQAPYATVLHRSPSAGEAMQSLPRLFLQCGGQSREIPLPPIPV
ncbi:MAG: hypothetical protein AB1347_05425 [Acidobacteriota bacterium]